MTLPEKPQPAGPLFEAHPRSFATNRYVYPVLSRRAGGISLGVNLNLDKVCNFDCIYCQVDRTELGRKEFVELARLETELEAGVELVTSGRIFDGARFSSAPGNLRRLHDIAFSGDGEPTSYRNFDRVVALAAEVRRRHRLDDVKLVLISNASMFHRDTVRAGLEILDRNNGEIWAKLDAGTEAYYRRIARSAIRFERILENLRQAAQVRPIVIQSLFMQMHGEPPAEEEIAAYGTRLGEITAASGRIKLVQVHTIARPPAEPWVAALSDAQLDALAARIGRQTGLPVATYYGSPRAP